jgi:hypothetical protein
MTLSCIPATYFIDLVEGRMAIEAWSWIRRRTPGAR